MKEVKVAVLLEHHKGDENWSAQVPLIPKIVVEGPTPDEAAKAVIPELEYFTQNPQVPNHKENLEALKDQPEFAITEVTFQIPENE